MLLLVLVMIKVFMSKTLDFLNQQTLINKKKTITTLLIGICDFSKR